MDRAYLIEVARRASRLTQAELATRSGTSQATMSAYERGLKSPTLKVAARILEAAGYDLALRRVRRLPLVPNDSDPHRPSAVNATRPLG